MCKRGVFYWLKWQKVRKFPEMTTFKVGKILNEVFTYKNYYKNPPETRFKFQLLEEIFIYIQM